MKPKDGALVQQNSIKAGGAGDPQYHKAFALGLSPDFKSEAFAWLASRLFKTVSHSAATSSVHQALCLTQDPELGGGFLVRLLRRIDRAANRPEFS